MYLVLDVVYLYVYDDLNCWNFGLFLIVLLVVVVNCFQDLYNKNIVFNKLLECGLQFNV